MSDPTPLELVFSKFFGTAFPAIQQSVERDGIDPTDRDAFLLLPDAVQLLHDLRPEEGLGEGMDYLVALVHHAYLAWDSGSLTLAMQAEQVEELVHERLGSEIAPAEAPRAYYVQFLGRQVWANVVDDQAAEPLDGCFIHSTPDSHLRVLGIFGFRTDRMGFSAVEASGPRPAALERADGTPLFSSVLGAGHLHSLIGTDELLELGWRTLGPARDAWARVA
jgi:hypothetical protein